MSHAIKRKLSSQKKKDIIYTSAIELFRENGYDNTSMQDISRVTGISIGSIYHHYRNKAEILRRFGLAINERLLNLIEPTADNINNAQECIYNYLLEMAGNFDQMGYDLVSHLHDNAGSIWIDMDGQFVQGSTMEKLKPFIECALSQGTLISPYSSEQIAEYLHIAGQGIIHTWIILGGNQPMTEMTASFLQVLFRSLFHESIEDES
ncbi:MAG: TetR/AcrR family transcriptional regulator [Lachnospiraceae bacterium]|nr:TetR/AcrR family transcriptional regulator [Lachnospiraceae bacterium]